MKFSLARIFRLKNGSTLQTAISEHGTILVRAIPKKRKHNQPKAGEMHLTRETAYVLIAALIAQLDPQCSNLDEFLCDKFLENVDLENE